MLRSSSSQSGQQGGRQSVGGGLVQPWSDVRGATLRQAHSPLLQQSAPAIPSANQDPFIRINGPRRHRPTQMPTTLQVHGPQDSALWHRNAPHCRWTTFVRTRRQTAAT